MYKNLHKRELEYIKPSTLGKGNNIIEHILCVRHTGRLFFYYYKLVGTERK